MPGINENTLHQRHTLLFIIVSVFVIAVCAVTLSILIINPGFEEEEEYFGRKHILFIVVDDLRPALGCYGDEKAITPNIDQLASKGVLFKNAYSQQALGGPSRISFLTSRRPDSLHLYDEESYWRDTVGSFITLPQHFKNHGYETISVGKIFQPGIVSNESDDYPYSWTEYPYHSPTENQMIEQFCNSSGLHDLICPVNIASQSDESLPDIENTQFAIEFLRNKSSGSDKTVPFFLGVGYNKPHIPFKFPKEYLNLYPLESMNLAPYNTIPHSLPKISWNPWMDIRNKTDVIAQNISFPYGPIAEDFQKKIRQGYYASVSYVDDLIGKLLNTLEETRFADHTTVVLLGDNGWSLGEHQEWSKYSNFEVSVRVPLIIYVPELMEKERTPYRYVPLVRKQAPTHNGSLESVEIPAPKFYQRYATDEIVELVDVFPTLAEIANIAIPPLCRLYTTVFCAEGISFYPLLEHLIIDPWIDFDWKTAAFSQYPRPSLAAQNNSDKPALDDIKYMGYSIRTKNYRYIEWLKFDNEEFKPDWPVIISRELYDHRHDPHEIDNVCDDDEYANTMIELSRNLKKGWRHTMPPGLFDSPEVIL